MMVEDDYHIDDETPRYARPEEIDPSALAESLNRLSLFGDDMFLRMQAFNLGVVDQFLTNLEQEVLQKLLEEERTPIAEAGFLSAQTQMWIFAAYEAVRTWDQRAKDIQKWHRNGGLQTKLKELEKDVGYLHLGRRLRADQIRQVLEDPTIIGRVDSDRRRTHILFAQMGALRISMAKHEVVGRRNSVALRPGYGRINAWCGSLDYELENGVYTMGQISRRDIAEGIRTLWFSQDPPSEEEIQSFDEFMRGPPVGDGFANP